MSAALAYSEAVMVKAKRRKLVGEGIPLTDFDRESLKWRGVVLTGKYRHWCAEWDELPTDETCPEFEVCHCFDKEESYG